MSAVDEYRKIRGLRWSQRTNEQWAVLAEKADAAIAELEQRVEDLESFTACREQTERIAELEAELERIDSFDGHLAWLHEHYPADIFTGESGDLGAVNVALSRKLLQAEAELLDKECGVKHEENKNRELHARIAELEALEVKCGDGEDHTGKTLAWVADCDTCRLRSEMCSVAYNDPACEDWAERGTR